MRTNLDAIDLRILKHLLEDGRRSFRVIAKSLGVAPGTVYARVLRQMKEGVIRKFTPNIDWSRIGYDITALILIRVKGPYLVEVEKRLAQKRGVCIVYDVTGDHDVALIAKFRDRGELNRFIKEVLAMEEVERTTTNVVLNIVKEELELPLPQA